jgi:hypothetical protein
MKWACQTLVATIMEIFTKHGRNVLTVLVFESNFHRVCFRLFEPFGGTFITVYC